MVTTLTKAFGDILGKNHDLQMIWRTFMKVFVTQGGGGGGGVGGGDGGGGGRGGF